jgi:hypothetical protein
LGNSPFRWKLFVRSFFSSLVLFWWLFCVQSLIMVERCNLFDRDNLGNLIAARFDENLIKLISVSLSSVKWLPFSSTYLFHRAINGLKHNSIIFLCFHTRYCLYSIYPHDVNIPMCTSSKVCNLIFFQKTFVRSLGMWNWL